MISFQHINKSVTSSKKGPLNICKIHRFSSPCTCTKYHPDFSSPFIYMYSVVSNRGIARNFLKMKPIYRISNFSRGTAFPTKLRSSKESLDVWLISAKQLLRSACAVVQADLSHCLADMWYCWKGCSPTHLMSSEQSEVKIRLTFGIYVEARAS